MSAPYYSSYTGIQVDAAVAAFLLLAPSYAGMFDLDEGIEGDVVEGLALSFTPTKIQLTIEIPPGGDSIFANPFKDTLSADGFTFQLSGIVGVGYRLYYTLTGEPS